MNLKICDLTKKLQDLTQKREMNAVKDIVNFAKKYVAEPTLSIFRSQLILKLFSVKFCFILARFPEMNWSVGNVAEEFKLFKQRMELNFIDKNITDSTKQATKIKIDVGNEGLRKINTSGLSPEDQNDPGKLWNL